MGGENIVEHRVARQEETAAGLTPTPVGSLHPQGSSWKLGCLGTVYMRSMLVV